MVAAANLVILMVAQWLTPTLAFADLLVQPLQSAVSIVAHNDLNGLCSCNYCQLLHLITLR